MGRWSFFIQSVVLTLAAAARVLVSPSWLVGGVLVGLIIMCFLTFPEPKP